MMQEPEDDRLDQSLRDTFSDFDLPPSSHIWGGIESQLSAIPGPPRTVPLSLLLPAVGLVGIAVGWLLPHPTKPTQEPQPTVTAQTAVQPKPLPAPVPLAYVSEQTPLHGNAVRIQVKANSTVTKRVRLVPTSAATSPNGQTATLPQLTDSTTLAAAVMPTMPPKPASSTTAAVAEPSFTQPVALASSPLAEKSAAIGTSSTLIAAPLQDTAGTTPPPYTSASPKQSLREWRPEYRTPKHRLEERGGRLRRIRNSITKHWQHLFGAHRSGQPTS
jgi:hypothetical protein